MVNRLWQHHFGAGLVRTPDDFGRMGQPPTHPELLDYLAAELVRGDWSLKSHAPADGPVERTYAWHRQSAICNPQIRKSIDPDNRLLWHMPVRRLEAEAIRDAILAVSGRLDGAARAERAAVSDAAHGRPRQAAVPGRSTATAGARSISTPAAIS